MLRHEFEKLAKVQGHISEMLYGSIEYSYMRTEETKQDFVARIFGTKRNSLRQIEWKWADSCRRGTYPAALRRKKGMYP